MSRREIAEEVNGPQSSKIPRGILPIFLVPGRPRIKYVVQISGPVSYRSTTPTDILVRGRWYWSSVLPGPSLPSILRTKTENRPLYDS